MKKVILLILVCFLTGCLMKLGKDALPLMTDAQKQVVIEAETYTNQTTINDLTKAFGPPVKMGVGGVNPEWSIWHDGKETRMRAYFISGGLDKVHYMSLDPMWGYIIHYDENGARPEF